MQSKFKRGKRRECNFIEDVCNIVLYSNEYKEGNESCSSYSKTDGKCIDTDKHCDGCASEFELNNTIQCPECGKPNTEETTSKGYYPSDYRYCDCGCPIEFK